MFFVLIKGSISPSNDVSMYLPYTSYSIWSQFQPAVGQERFHCAMQRGFLRARKKEPEVDQIIKAESPPLKIGHWVQKGIFVLHTDFPHLLDESQAIEQVLQRLTLDSNEETLRLTQESSFVQKRVTEILQRYQANPILKNKKIVALSSGDEGIPDAITIRNASPSFNLYAPFDCLLEEEDGTLHILDIKTGKSDFDLRQGLVYLFAASVLYPHRSCLASFYNVDTQKSSPIMTQKPEQLLAVKVELARIAKLHQQQLQRYRRNPDNFPHIYPHNSGLACRYCQFQDICDFSATSA